MNKEELEKLYNEIIDEMWNIFLHDQEDTSEGVARQKQKEIIKKINAHPEVLRVQSIGEGYRTIGIRAASYGLFYVTIRALQDGEACMLNDIHNHNVYDYIRSNNIFRERLVNSQEYKALVERLESQAAEFDEYEDMSKYDSIME